MIPPQRTGGVGISALSFVLHVAGLMAGVIGAAMITTHWFPNGDEPGGFVAMGGMLILLCGGLYWSVRRSMRARGMPSGERPSWPAMPASPTIKAQPAPQGGCLMLIGFTILIVGGGIGAALGTYCGLNMIVSASVPGGSTAYNVSLSGALIACLSVMFLLDRWCVRKTGNSVIELLSALSW